MNEDEHSGLSGVTLDSVDGDVLARRLTALARAGRAATGEWDAIQTELARRRVREARPPAPISPSLRSQILALLADAPGMTPSQIAEALSRSTTVVSRVLATLLQHSVVAFDADSGDGRIRRYRIAGTAGSGTVSPPHGPSPDERERQYLSLVIATAVRARRRSNDLDYAADRLGRALEQSVKLGADNLALVARRELITTLRQARRFDELGEHLAVLQDIESGVAPVEPGLALPATGVIAYELGRQPDRSSLDRYKHLTTAATVFRRCSVLNDSTDWCPREAWALMATADLWRDQTEFGIALACAEQAAAVFQAYDDTYGAAEAARVQGFCERLRGNFGEAIAMLEIAAGLAKATSADRCLADVLLQLGDAHRCSGNLDDARSCLHEAAKIATRLDRRHTIGFALTSLASVEFADASHDEAWKRASEAASWLETSPGGSALNSRRRAVIARELSSDGERSMRTKSLELFRESLTKYEALGSPSGIAACHVGIGRVSPAGSSVSCAVGDLVRVASTGSGRLLIPLDPWVPNLVRQWADETDMDDVRRVADWTFSIDRERPVASEMAGEPRVESKLLAA